MAGAAAENDWELRVERLVPLKRHVAYRVMVSRIAEWWWHPLPSPVSEFKVDWRANGTFRITGNNHQVLQEGIILETRPGWYFYMTDALRPFGHPGTPSMVASWSVNTTPRDHPFNLGNDCSTIVSKIRHFSETDYLRNVGRGLEQGWNESADRLVTLCEERPRPTR